MLTKDEVEAIKCPMPIVCLAGPYVCAICGRCWRMP